MKDEDLRGVLWDGILKVLPLINKLPFLYPPKSIYYSVRLEFDSELKLGLGLLVVFFWGGGDGEGMQFLVGIIFYACVCGVY